MISDSEVDLETKKILMEKQFVAAVNMASDTATSELEGFHSLVNQYAPKMEGFSYSGMLSR